jgi:hypothetical protein
MFFTVPGCKFESVPFLESESNHMALGNVTLGKCIRDQGSIVVNLLVA